MKATAVTLASVLGAGCILLTSACSGSRRVQAATPPPPVYHDLQSFYRTLPAADVQSLNTLQATTLAIYSLSCMDRIEAPRGGAAPTAAANAAPPPAYLWQSEGASSLFTGYSSQRAFYGCNDWHSAVASTWLLAAVLKRYPEIPLSSLIREKLNDHLARRNLEGEIAYFQGARSFERPYGWAWAMRLYMEISDWNDPDAQKWTANLKPLITQFATALPGYLNDLPDATRQPTTANTANAMRMLYLYADWAHDQPLLDALNKSAHRLFDGDQDCPTAYETDATSVLSPCLEEAVLMSKVLGKPSFTPWFDKFMPPAFGRAFRPLATAYDPALLAKPDQFAAKSANRIGLAFSRAEDFVEIAAALPPADARVPVYRRLAALESAAGYQAMSVAGYSGASWMPPFAMMYQLNNGAAPAIPKEKLAAVAVPAGK